MSPEDIAVIRAWSRSDLYSDVLDPDKLLALCDAAERAERLEEDLQDCEDAAKAVLGDIREFMARGENLDSQTIHGCICVGPGNPVKGLDGKSIWTIRPDCGYHATAARYPHNHAIPWNCPTYWDGCNCKATIAKLRAALAEPQPEVRP